MVAPRNDSDRDEERRRQTQKTRGGGHGLHGIPAFVFPKLAGNHGERVNGTRAAQKNRGGGIGAALRPKPAPRSHRPEVSEGSIAVFGSRSVSWRYSFGRIGER